MIPPPPTTEPTNNNRRSQRKTIATKSEYNLPLGEKEPTQEELNALLTNTNPGKISVAPVIPIAPVAEPPIDISKLPAVPTTPLIGPQPKPKPKVKPKKPTGAGSKTPSALEQILEQAWGLPDPISGLKPRAGFIPALNMSTNKYGYVNRDFLKKMKPGPGTWMPGPGPNFIPSVANTWWNKPDVGEQIQPAGASKKKRKKGPVPNPNLKRIDELARQPIPGTSKTSTTSNEAKIIQLKAKANKLLKVTVSLNEQYPNKIAFYQQILKDLKEISKYNPSQDETVTESSKHLERFGKNNS